MKKRASLSLNRETLRRLNDLTHVAGGTSCGDATCVNSCGLFGCIEEPVRNPFGDSQCTYCCAA